MANSQRNTKREKNNGVLNLCHDGWRYAGPRGRRKTQARIRLRRVARSLFDDFLGGVMAEQMGKPFDLLLGRKHSKYSPVTGPIT